MNQRKNKKNTSVRIEPTMSTWKLESNCLILVCLYSTGSEALYPWECNLHCVNQFMSSIWEISLLFQFTSAHPRSSATTKIIFGCFSLLSCAYNSCMKKKINIIFNLECGYEGLIKAPTNPCKFIDLLKRPSDPCEWLWVRSLPVIMASLV